MLKQPSDYEGSGDDVMAPKAIDVWIMLRTVLCLRHWVIAEELHGVVDNNFCAAPLSVMKKVRFSACSALSGGGPAALVGRNAPRQTRRSPWAREHGRLQCAAGLAGPSDGEATIDAIANRVSGWRVSFGVMGLGQWC